ncbi:MAG: penicillin-binding protein [Ktedonobacteraceae bacterium]|nr:penicillin-binding protein [Ktedonobacteraceae bacterium]
MNISSSIRKLSLLFIMLFVALSGGLVYWQVLAASAVASNPHNGRACLPDSAPVRGRIFDRNGVLLAESVRDDTMPCGYRRKYTDPSLAGLIGYYISPLYPATGIEKEYNDYLNGQIGMTAMDNSMNKLLHRPPIGNDIYLTIDERIQQIADKHFDDPISIDNSNTFRTDRGSVIVMNPHTGEVLAMVSRPKFDPNRLVTTVAKSDFSYFNSLVKDKQQPLLERPLQAKYIPGSTYKTVTLMAALENGTTTLNQQFNEKEALGPIFINGQKFGPDGNNIQNYTKRFPVTTEYGFVHSDNIIFAQIGVSTGIDKWMEFNKKFYVGEKIPFDLPVTPSTVTRGDEPLEKNGLAANAFGQGFDSVTPLQMALFNNAVANDGQLMRPMLVAKITDHDGNPTETFGPKTLSQPLSAANAALVRQAMFGVVRCGSGSIVTQLFNSQVSIIGKTGTAQVDNAGKIPAHSWLITQAPYSINNPSQLPALTIVGMKENGGEGGAVTGPMIAHIYQDVFAKGYVQAQLPQVPTQEYCFRTGLLQ